ncbi:hypothetical protein BC936DRAFT_146459 [Jimgerdemannia flammicorona]|uniref:Uncharacterized protein n=1 Tax=Jimgerdemannia flammicorona TaxID=994334 RepID=A0A433D7K1_9FUNG|nr:hypothetical protein BC936DRAFT_146459 [Jimgerdemannia flammicorona]
MPEFPDHSNRSGARPLGNRATRTSVDGHRIRQPDNLPHETDDSPEWSRSNNLIDTCLQGNIKDIIERLANNNSSRTNFLKDWYAHFGERKTLLASILDPDGKVRDLIFY